MSASSASSLYSAFCADRLGLATQQADGRCSVYSSTLADRIVADVHPATVLDVGCAAGLLVQALRQRGVEAQGIDNSPAAIDHAPPPVKPFCRVRSVTEPLSQRFDLVVCLDVLEHLQSPDAELAIANLCAHSDDILFSACPRPEAHISSSDGSDAAYWTEQFARHGFYRDIEYDASFISPWAGRYRKLRQPLESVLRGYEAKLRELEQEIRVHRQRQIEQQSQLAERVRTAEALRAQLASADKEIEDKTRLVRSLISDNASLIQTVATELPRREQNRAEQEQIAQQLRHELRNKEQRIQSLQGDLAKLAREFAQQLARKGQLQAKTQSLGCQVKHARLAKREHARVVSRRMKALIKRLHQCTDELSRQSQTIETLHQQRAQMEQTHQQQLAEISASRAWRLVQKLRQWRHRLLPRHSYRERIARLGVRGMRIWRSEGLGSAVYRGGRKLGRKLHHVFGRSMPSLAIASAAAAPVGPRDPSYILWIQQNEPNAAELNRQRSTFFAQQPMISIVVPVFNTPARFLSAMIDSVREQTYPRWELCLADGGSSRATVKVLRKYTKLDGRIRVKHLAKNQGIAGNSNAGLAMATGDYIALLDHDDTLAPFALFEVVRSINADPDADFLYSDEDKIDAEGSDRWQPHFKPDWSPDTFRSHNYICHLSCFRRDLLNKVGGFASGFDGSQDYDLFLRASEKAQRIVHIPKVLYHWRIHPESCAGSIDAKTYAMDSAKKALKAHVDRTGLYADVADGKVRGVYEVRHRLRRNPLVSIVISNKDNQPVLERCVRSVLANSYENYEILIVENHSQEARTFDYYRQLQRNPKVRVVRWDKTFNYSAVNNFGVQQSQGEMVLLLNNDVEAIHADWLERMMEHGVRPEVGAVGAKLYYPNDTVQHAGVILALGGIAGHIHKHAPRTEYGYFGRLMTTQNLSAVTAACLLTKRSVYDQVGGLDEAFILAFNDVDLCCKIRKAGHLVVWTPYAELYHHESYTRGMDDTPDKKDRFFNECRLFATRWQKILESGDPYYNPAFTWQRDNFSLQIDPDRPWRLAHFLSCLPPPASATEGDSEAA